VTQGERLIDVIRAMRSHFRRWPTYMDLLRSGVSTAPHKRLFEPSAQRALRQGEKLERGKDAQGRVVFKIVRK
jgi:hypothetical protein